MPQFPMIQGVLAALLLVSSPAVMAAQTDAPAEVSPKTYAKKMKALIRDAKTMNDTQRLHLLFDAHWNEMMDQFPTWASYVGHPGGEGRWTDMSFKAIEKREKNLSLTLKAAQSIQRENLSEADQLNYDLFIYDLEDGQAGNAFPWEYLAIGQMDGPQREIPNTLRNMSTARAQDFEHILQRMDAIPQVLDDTVALLKKGQSKGIMPPQVVLRDLPAQVLALCVEDRENNPLMAVFKSPRTALSAAEIQAFEERAWQSIQDKAIPAFQELHDYLVADYIPAAPQKIGLGQLKDGQDWYNQRIRHYTTTQKSAQEIHDIGLAEVKRIRVEMDKVIADSGFTGSFEAFTEFLRTDPQFYYEKPEDLITGYRDIAKRADAELPQLFGLLPRLPYGVKEIPAHTAKSQTTAYYYQGSLKTGRPGNFYANTYALDSRPKWEMEALTLHEAVPGHHLQISLAQELEDLPAFRQQAGFTAYIEGWALYAESLGTQMGFYQDPYSKFGQLTYEMWRAVRLVVDTGMHALGWSRQEAIDFFTKNTGKTEHDITVEIDRYIAWPGQALAYKIGERHISALRSEAEARLGPDFNIRAFHDVVLGAGAVPLDILEMRVMAWIDSEAANQ